MFKTRPTWIDLFAATMTKLGVRADPDHIVDLAEVMYEIHSDLDPGSVARAELDKWPVPHGDRPQQLALPELRHAGLRSSEIDALGLTRLAKP